MKKISIIGKGTVGCLAVSHFLRWTDWEIDWVYDPNIQTSPVGEGTNLHFPRALFENILFDTEDMESIQSTPKLGIWKKGWGAGKEFKHTFPVGTTGIHFNALDFQEYIFKKFVNHPRIQIVEDNVNNFDLIDSDYIMSCSGSPKELTDDYIEHKNIPVNSAMVFQCPWELPKFLYSLTFARKYGWVFGIPLKNRCAIGYVYNKDFCTEDDIKNDVQPILDQFDLTPAKVRSLNFLNYSRKNNFTERVCYNGNASFFLEPLEATSTGHAVLVNKLAIDLWHLKSRTPCEADQFYRQELDDIESMICLHYFSGSVYKNDFWNYAKNLAKEKISKKVLEKNNFSDMVKSVCLSTPPVQGDVGSWPFLSYKNNISGLGLTEKLKNILNEQI